MGSVYRAEPLSGGAPFALKLVGPQANTDARSLERFQREVECGARIASPHVARTLDASDPLDGTIRWLAMEFAEGPDLAELVRARGALRGALARRVLGQLFAAVASAHQLDIVHRDLKPNNVRVAGVGDELFVKVLDFGIAKDLAAPTHSATTPGLGTPLWAAPEQGRRGYRPLPTADVWALGLLTFFTLTGAVYWRHADERASLADLALELLRGELVPASARAGHLGLGERLPAGFDAWFARAVVREPEQRFVNAAEAWLALEPLLAEHAEPPRASSPERATLVVRPGVFVTAVIVSVVAAGLAIYWLLRTMHV